MPTTTTTTTKKLKMIAIDLKNYESLQMLGRVPESFNDVIRRVLEQNQKYQSQRMEKLTE
jgi:predicted CopG family antitoxin